MPCHPCTGHACDHCSICEDVGICCASSRSAAVTANAGTLSDLRDALAENRRAGPVVRHLRCLTDLPDRTTAPTGLAALHGVNSQLALPPGTTDPLLRHPAFRQPEPVNHQKEKHE